MTPSRREALILGVAGVAAAAAGFVVGPLLLKNDPEQGDGILRSATMVDLSGTPRALAEWAGRVLLWNFWATWCAPCREEIPLLIAAREKYGSSGIEIVGIAVDNPSKVREFSSSFNISYPILLGEANGLELMRKLGNSSGGLPYTVVADREGKVVYRKLGAFKRSDLDAILGPLARTSPA